MQAASRRVVVNVAADSLALTDLVEIAGVVVAVVTAVLAPLWREQRRTAAKLTALQTELRDVRSHCNSLQQMAATSGSSQSHGLSAIMGALEAEAGLLHRVMLGRAAEVDADAAMRRLREARDGVERAAAESAALFGDKKSQLAAVQLLSHRLGNRHTVVFFEGAAALGSVGALREEHFRAAVGDLSARLADES
jgi:hypothetical protein